MSCRIVADLKAINLITGISTHSSHAVLQTFNELVALTGITGLSAYSEQVVETQHRYYESHCARFLANSLNHEISKEKLLKLSISYNPPNL